MPRRVRFARVVMLAILLWMGTRAVCAAGDATDPTFMNAKVRDPDAAFIDVPARRAFLRDQASRLPVAALPERRRCDPSAAPPPVGAMVVPHRYIADAHGAITPGYDAAVNRYRVFEDAVSHFANLYVRTGDSDDARCVLAILARWADAGAFLDYDPHRDRQAWFQTEWSMTAAGLALSLVRADAALDRATRDRILAWMVAVVRKQTGYPGGDNTKRNNHAYWRGAEAAIVGVVAKDDDLFRWGLQRYAIGIGEISADGSFPLEMARHELAVHYQNFAILPLVLIAEVASRQGIDLYAFEGGGHRLVDAITYLNAALGDPAVVAPHAPEPQDLHALAPGQGDLAWRVYYHARFGGEDPWLAVPPGFFARAGGSATLLAGSGR